MLGVIRETPRALARGLTLEQQLDSPNQALNWSGLCVAAMLGMIRETTRTLTRGLTLGFIRLREQLQHT